MVHVGELGVREDITQCFSGRDLIGGGWIKILGTSKGDQIGGGSVNVEIVPMLPSWLASMYQNTKSELPGGSGLGELSVLQLSMTIE